MSESYNIFTVNVEGEPQIEQIEQMGTKKKFWLFNTETNERWLFKYNRPDTGEDWSEKIASEIAELIGLPHAITHLAELAGERGILVKDFTEGKKKGHLVHGNELLTAFDPKYPSNRFRKVSQHSIENIVGVLSNLSIQLPKGYCFPPRMNNAVGLFLGYLMLDALIGNTDRHHENWGILLRKESSEQPFYRELAPTFDHASSLGRELSETRREELLAGQGYKVDIPTYALRGRSAIYLNAGDRKPLTTFDAFTEFSNHILSAKDIWLDKLADVTEDSLRNCAYRVPNSLWGPRSCEFVCRLLEFNKDRLLNL